VQAIGKLPIGLCFALLAVSVCIAYVTPVSSLLAIEIPALRGLAATLAPRA